MSLPRYPKYKDSGVEWLGSVPQHWEVTAIKRLADHVTDGAHISPDTENGVYPFVSTKDVGDDSIDFQGCLRTSEATYEYMVRTGCRPEAGDVLFSKDGTIGRTVVVRDACEFVVASSLIIIRPNRTLLASRFLHHLCQSSAIASQVDSFVRGAGLPRLSIQNLLRIVGCFPPLSEQNAIAAFLDDETAKIDALVAEQERLIELLKEKRQAATSDAATNGLRLRVPMKHSGVEWLGQVPAHWRLQRGRFLFRKLELPPEPEDGVVTAFRDGQVTLRENRRTDGFTVAVLEVGYQRVREGDLVVHGMDAFAGAIGVSESTGKCTPEYAVLTALADNLNGYFALVLRLMAQRDFIFVICPSVRERAPRFRFEALKDVVLPVPPVEEQREILSLVDAAGRQVSALVAEAQRAIDLLEERRTALISAAVTGQIDVREASGKAA